MDASPNVLAEVCIPDILGRTASFLPPNEIACTLRLVNRETAEQFRGHVSVRLSQPFPAETFAAQWSSPGACRVLSRERRLQLLRLTTASGDVANLEVALAAAGLCPNAQPMAASAAAGQLHVCRWLAERGCPLEGLSPRESPPAAAAKGGHAEICEWLLEQGCTLHPECVLAAARGGHPELMRALLSRAPPGLCPQPDLLRAAAEGCDLQTLQALWREWAADRNCASLAACAAFRSLTPDWAAKVAWLLEQGADRCNCAAAGAWPDAFARLTLLVEGLGFPVDDSAVDAAVYEGRADATRWLLARGLRPDQPCWILDATREGHTEVLRALHTGGCLRLPPSGLFLQACRSGSVETASWVVEAFGPAALRGADSFAFEVALDSGSLELVTWLDAMGLCPGPGRPRPWVMAAMPFILATRGGCAAVIELMAELGVAAQGASSEPLYVYRLAAEYGDLLILEALPRLGIPLGRTPEERRALVAQGIEGRAPLPALRWLRRAVGDVDWAAARKAARSAPEPAAWRAEVLAWVEAEAKAEAEAENAV